MSEVAGETLMVVGVIIPDFIPLEVFGLGGGLSSPASSFSSSVGRSFAIFGVMGSSVRFPCSESLVSISGSFSSGFDDFSANFYKKVLKCSTILIPVMPVLNKILEHVRQDTYTNFICSTVITAVT